MASARAALAPQVQKSRSRCGLRRSLGICVLVKLSHRPRDFRQGLHPDKVDSDFWTPARKDRLKATFQFANNVQELARRHFDSFMVDSVEDVRFVWRLGAAGKMELCLSWRKQPELDTIIFFYDNTCEREVVVTDASSFTFNETDEPVIFSASFEGFQLYHQVAYGALQGV